MASSLVSSSSPSPSPPPIFSSPQQIFTDIKSAAMLAFLHEEFVHLLYRYAEDLRSLYHKGAAVFSEVQSTSSSFSLDRPSARGKGEGGSFLGGDLLPAVQDFLSLCLTQSIHTERLANRLKSEVATPIEAVLEDVCNRDHHTKQPSYLNGEGGGEKEKEQDRSASSSPLASVASKRKLPASPAQDDKHASGLENESGKEAGGGVRIEGVHPASTEVQKALKKLQLAQEEMKRADESLKELVSLFGSSVAPGILQKAQDRVVRAKKLHDAALAEYNKASESSSSSSVSVSIQEQHRLAPGGAEEETKKKQKVQSRVTSGRERNEKDEKEETTATRSHSLSPSPKANNKMQGASPALVWIPSLLRSRSPEESLNENFLSLVKTNTSSQSSHSNNEATVAETSRNSKRLLAFSSSLAATSILAIRSAAKAFLEYFHTIVPSHLTFIKNLDDTARATALELKLKSVYEEIEAPLVSKDLEEALASNRLEGPAGGGLGVSSEEKKKKSNRNFFESLAAGIRAARGESEPLSSKGGKYPSLDYDPISSSSCEGATLRNLLKEREKKIEELEREKTRQEAEAKTLKDSYHELRRREMTRDNEAAYLKKENQRLKALLLSQATTGEARQPQSILHLPREGEGNSRGVDTPDGSRVGGVACSFERQEGDENSTPYDGLSKKEGYLMASPGEVSLLHLPESRRTRREREGEKDAEGRSRGGEGWERGTGLNREFSLDRSRDRLSSIDDEQGSSYRCSSSSSTRGRERGGDRGESQRKASSSIMKERQGTNPNEEKKHDEDDKISLYTPRRLPEDRSRDVGSIAHSEAEEEESDDESVASSSSPTVHSEPHRMKKKKNRRSLPLIDKKKETKDPSLLSSSSSVEFSSLLAELRYEMFLLSIRRLPLTLLFSPCLYFYRHFTCYRSSIFFKHHSPSSSSSSLALLSDETSRVNTSPSLLPDSSSSPKRLSPSRLSLATAQPSSSSTPLPFHPNSSSSSSSSSSSFLEMGDCLPPPWESKSFPLCLSSVMEDTAQSILPSYLLRCCRRAVASAIARSPSSSVGKITAAAKTREGGGMTGTVSAFSQERNMSIISIKEIKARQEQNELEREKMLQEDRGKQSKGGEGGEQETRRRGTGRDKGRGEEEEAEERGYSRSHEMYEDLEFSEEDLQMLAYELVLLTVHQYSQYTSYALLIANPLSSPHESSSSSSFLSYSGGSYPLENFDPSRKDLPSESLDRLDRSLHEREKKIRQRESLINDDADISEKIHRRETHQEGGDLLSMPIDDPTSLVLSSSSSHASASTGYRLKQNGALENKSSSRGGKFLRKSRSFGLLGGAGSLPSTSNLDAKKRSAGSRGRGGREKEEEEGRRRREEEEDGENVSERSSPHLVEETKKKKRVLSRREYLLQQDSCPYGVKLSEWMNRTQVISANEEKKKEEEEEENVLHKGPRKEQEEEEESTVMLCDIEPVYKNPVLREWICPDAKLLNANFHLLLQLAFLSRINFQIPSSGSNKLLRLLLPGVDCIWGCNFRGSIHPLDLRFRLLRLQEAWKLSSSPAVSSCPVSTQELERRKRRQEEEEKVHRRRLLSSSHAGLSETGTSNSTSFSQQRKKRGGSHHGRLPLFGTGTTPSSLGGAVVEGAKKMHFATKLEEVFTFPFKAEASSSSSSPAPLHHTNSSGSGSSYHPNSHINSSTSSSSLHSSSASYPYKSGGDRRSGEEGRNGKRRGAAPLALSMSSSPFYEGEDERMRSGGVSEKEEEEKERRRRVDPKNGDMEGERNGRNATTKKSALRKLNSSAAQALQKGGGLLLSPTTGGMGSQGVSFLPRKHSSTTSTTTTPRGAGGGEGELECSLSSGGYSSTYFTSRSYPKNFLPPHVLPPPPALPGIVSRGKSYQKSSSKKRRDDEEEEDRDVGERERKEEGQQSNFLPLLSQNSSSSSSLPFSHDPVFKAFLLRQLRLLRMSVLLRFSRFFRSLFSPSSLLQREQEELERRRKKGERLASDEDSSSCDPYMTSTTSQSDRHSKKKKKSLRRERRKEEKMKRKNGDETISISSLSLHPGGGSPSPFLSSLRQNFEKKKTGMASARRRRRRARGFPDESSGREIFFKKGPAAGRSLGSSSSSISGDEEEEDEEKDEKERYRKGDGLSASSPSSCGGGLGVYEDESAEEEEEGDEGECHPFSFSSLSYVEPCPSYMSFYVKDKESEGDEPALLYFLLSLLCRGTSPPEAPFWRYRRKSSEGERKTFSSASSRETGEGVNEREREKEKISLCRRKQEDLEKDTSSSLMWISSSPERKERKNARREGDSRPPALILLSREELETCIDAGASLHLLPIRQLSTFYHMFLYIYELERLISRKSSSSSPCGGWGDDSIQIELLEVDIHSETLLSQSLATGSLTKKKGREGGDKNSNGDFYRQKGRENDHEREEDEEEEEEDFTWEVKCTWRSRGGQEILQRLLFMMTACADLDTAIRLALARRWERKVHRFLQLQGGASSSSPLLSEGYKGDRSRKDSPDIKEEDGDVGEEGRYVGSVSLKSRRHFISTTDGATAGLLSPSDCEGREPSFSSSLPSGSLREGREGVETSSLLATPGPRPPPGGDRSARALGSAGGREIGGSDARVSSPSRTTMARHSRSTSRFFKRSRSARLFSFGGSQVLSAGAGRGDDEGGEEEEKEKERNLIMASAKTGRRMVLKRGESQHFQGGEEEEAEGMRSKRREDDEEGSLFQSLGQNGKQIEGVEREENRSGRSNEKKEKRSKSVSRHSHHWRGKSHRGEREEEEEEEVARGRRRKDKADEEEEERGGGGWGENRSGSMMDILGIPREPLLSSFWVLDNPLLVCLLLLLSRCCADMKNPSGLHVEAPRLVHALLLVAQTAQLGIDPTAVSSSSERHLKSMQEESSSFFQRDQGAYEEDLREDKSLPEFAHHRSTREKTGGAAGGDKKEEDIHSSEKKRKKCKEGKMKKERSSCLPFAKSSIDFHRVEELKRASRNGGGQSPLSLQSTSLLLAACVWGHASDCGTFFSTFLQKPSFSFSSYFDKDLSSFFPSNSPASSSSSHHNTSTPHLLPCRSDSAKKCCPSSSSPDAQGCGVHTPPHHGKEDEEKHFTATATSFYPSDEKEEKKEEDISINCIKNTNHIETSPNTRDTSPPSSSRGGRFQRLNSLGFPYSRQNEILRDLLGNAHPSYSSSLTSTGNRLSEGVEEENKKGSSHQSSSFGNPPFYLSEKEQDFSRFLSSSCCLSPSLDIVNGEVIDAVSEILWSFPLFLKKQFEGDISDALEASHIVMAAPALNVEGSKGLSKQGQERNICLSPCSSSSYRIFHPQEMSIADAAKHPDGELPHDSDVDNASISLPPSSIVSKSGGGKTTASQQEHGGRKSRLRAFSRRKSFFLSSENDRSSQKEKDHLPDRQNTSDQDSLAGEEEKEAKDTSSLLSSSLRSHPAHTTMGDKEKGGRSLSLVASLARRKKAASAMPGVSHTDELAASMKRASHGGRYINDSHTHGLSANSRRRRKEEEDDDEKEREIGWERRGEHAGASEEEEGVLLHRKRAELLLRGVPLTWFAMTYRPCMREKGESKEEEKTKKEKEEEEMKRMDGSSVKDPVRRPGGAPIDERGNQRREGSHRGGKEGPHEEEEEERRRKKEGGEKKKKDTMATSLVAVERQSFVRCLFGKKNTAAGCFGGDWWILRQEEENEESAERFFNKLFLWERKRNRKEGNLEMSVRRTTQEVWLAKACRRTSPSPFASSSPSSSFCPPFYNLSFALPSRMELQQEEFVSSQMIGGFFLLLLHTQLQDYRRHFDPPLLANVLKIWRYLILLLFYQRHVSFSSSSSSFVSLSPTSITRLGEKHPSSSQTSSQHVDSASLPFFFFSSSSPYKGHQSCNDRSVEEEKTKREGFKAQRNRQHAFVSMNEESLFHTSSYIENKKKKRRGRRRDSRDIGTRYEREFLYRHYYFYCCIDGWRSLDRNLLEAWKAYTRARLQVLLHPTHASSSSSSSTGAGGGADGGMPRKSQREEEERGRRRREGADRRSRYGSRDFRGGMEQQGGEEGVGRRERIAGTRKKSMVDHRFFKREEDGEDDLRNDEREEEEERRGDIVATALSSEEDESLFSSSFEKNSKKKVHSRNIAAPGGGGGEEEERKVHLSSSSSLRHNHYGRKERSLSPSTTTTSRRGTVRERFRHLFLANSRLSPERPPTSSSSLRKPTSRHYYPSSSSFVLSPLHPSSSSSSSSSLSSSSSHAIYLDREAPPSSSLVSFYLSLFPEIAEEEFQDEKNCSRLSLVLRGPSLFEDLLRCFIYQSLSSVASREFHSAFSSLSHYRRLQEQGEGYSYRTKVWKRTTDHPIPRELLLECEIEQDYLLQHVSQSCLSFVSQIRSELLLYSPVFVSYLPFKGEHAFLILSLSRVFLAALLSELLQVAVWAGAGGEVELLPPKGGSQLLHVLSEFECLTKEVSLSGVVDLDLLSSPALLPPLAPAFLSSLSLRLNSVSSMLLSFLEKETYIPLNPPEQAYSEKALDSWHLVFNLVDAVFTTPAPIDWVLPPFLQFLRLFFIHFASFSSLSPSTAALGSSSSFSSSTARAHHLLQGEKIDGESQDDQAPKHEKKKKKKEEKKKDERHPKKNTSYEELLLTFRLPLLAAEQRQLKNFLVLLSPEGRDALAIDSPSQSIALLSLADLSNRGRHRGPLGEESSFTHSHHKKKSILAGWSAIAKLGQSIFGEDEEQKKLRREKRAQSLSSGMIMRRGSGGVHTLQLPPNASSSSASRGHLSDCGERRGEKGEGREKSPMPG
ncbi:hypothetical protein CSUI_004556, partial [Cystoisospora suis]